MSRETSPLGSAVLSVTVLRAGHAYNVIPDVAEFGGTIRCDVSMLDVYIDSPNPRFCCEPRCQPVRHTRSVDRMARNTYVVLFLSIVCLHRQLIRWVAAAGACPVA